MKPLASLLLPGLCCFAHAADTDNLVGTWIAQPEVRGQAGEVIIYIETTKDGALSAALELPQIQSRRIGLGEVSIEGTLVRIGPLELAASSDGGELAGTLPAAIVPVYEVPVVFRKTDAPIADEAPRELGPRREPAWTFATEAAIWGGALVSGDALFFGSDDSHLYSLDAKTGAFRWKTRTGGAIRSTPAEINDDILFQSDDGYLYRIAKSDGAEVWKVPLSKGEIRPVDRASEDYSYNHYASAVTVANGAGYIGTYDGEIISLDLESGEIAWRFATDGPVLGQPAISNELLIGTSWDGNVYALKLTTGELVWKTNAGGHVVSFPAVTGTAVFVGTRGYDLIALDPDTGEREWDYYFWFSWVESPPLVADDVVLAGGSDGGAILAFDAKSGSKRWEFDTTGSVWAPLARSGKTIYAGAVGVREYIVAHEPGFFAVDLETGSPRWSYLPPATSAGGGTLSGFAAAPAVGEELVYAGSLDGRLYAFWAGNDDAVSGASPQTPSPDEEPDY